MANTGPLDDFHSEGIRVTDEDDHITVHAGDPHGEASLGTEDVADLYGWLREWLQREGRAR
jgi:hypothetical protein